MISYMFHVLLCHENTKVNREAMNRIIYDKYDKKSITKLPKAEFQGKIRVVISEQEAEKAVDYLLTCNLLGVDTETRPSFKKGKQNVVALLQVANDDICFLFRLNLMGLSPAIIRFLEDTTVPKVGLSLHDDILSLSKRGEFTPGNFIDLQDHMTELGIQDLSLQKLYANIFHEKISKAQQLSNWEADILSDRQKIYAATDAWACIMLYREYQRMMTAHDFELQIMENECEKVTDK